MKVLIGQNQSFKSHAHRDPETRSMTSGGDYINYGEVGSLHGYTAKAGNNNVGSTYIYTPAHDTGSTGGIETRPLNVSNKFWKRIC